MKKYILGLLALTFTFGSAHAQMEEGFESLNLDSGTVLNGSDGSLSFDNGTLHMPLGWDTSWGGYWASGWALSSKINGQEGASDFNSQLYCAKPAWGAEGAGQGKTFAIGQNGAYLLNKSGGGMTILSFYIANTTYAFNSMKNGDMFAKKFGGNSGSDADSFVLEIESFMEGNSMSKQRVALADFRSSNSNEDSIMGGWNLVFLQSFLQDSIVFRLFSSDNGDFGMNTPAFFALDRILVGRTESVEQLPTLADLSAFPNPSFGAIELRSSWPIDGVQVQDVQGRVMAADVQSLGLGRAKVSMHAAPGVYTLRVQSGAQTKSLRWICQ